MAKIEQRIAIRGENKSRAAFKQVGKSLSNLGRRASQVGRTVGIGLAAGTAGIVALTKQTLDQADALGKLSQQTGLTVGELQKYAFAAGQTGTKQELFNTGMQAFAKRLGELKSGTGSLLGFLKKADPEFAKVLETSNNTGEALRLLADKMAGIEDPADRAALGAAAFSRSAGVALANTLSEGSEGLAKYGEELEKTGSVMDEKGVAAAEKFNDALDKLSRSTLGAFRKAITDMAPQLQEWAETLAEKAPAAIQKLVKWLKDAGPELKAFVGGIGSVAEAVSTLIDVFQTVGTTIGESVAKVVLFTQDIVTAITDMKDKAVRIVQDMVEGIKKWFTSPLDSIVDSTKGAVEKVVGWFQWGADETVNQSIIPDMVMDIGGWMDQLPDVMGRPAQDASELMTSTFRTMSDSISSILRDVLLNAKSFGDALEDIFTNIGLRIADKLIDSFAESVAGSILGSGGSAGGIISGVASKIGGGIGSLFGGGAVEAGTGAVASPFAGLGSFSAAAGPAAAFAGMFAAFKALSGGPAPLATASQNFARGAAPGGALGLRFTQAQGNLFAAGPNAGFAAAFAQGQGIGARRPGEIGLNAERRGIAGFHGVRGVEHLQELLEDAEQAFERLKATGAEVFQGMGVDATQMGQILQDGIIDRTELQMLGMERLGEITVSQFDRMMEAVNGGTVRLEALRGETMLNQREVEFLGELGFTAAELIRLGFDEASVGAREALRRLREEGVSGFNEITAAANAAASAASAVGGGEPRDPNVTSTTTSTSRTLRRIERNTRGGGGL